MTPRTILLYKQSIEFALSKCPMEHPSFQGLVISKFSELILAEVDKVLYTTQTPWPMAYDNFSKAIKKYFELEK